MRKSKFSETQIVALLKDAESGVPRCGPAAEAWGQQGHVLQVAEQIRRRHGVRREAVA